MPKSEGGSSRTHETYEQLRTELVQGMFGPGQAVKPAEVAQRMGVSLGAVREALSRLSAEGLVLSEPHRGFRVAPVSEDDLRHLLEARNAIEVLCLRRAIQCGDLAWEGRIVAAFHHLSRIPEEGSTEEVNQDWISAHEAFHQGLVGACDNAWLLRMRQTLYIQCERYRSRLVQRGDQVGRDLNSEHRTIMEAVLERNQERSVSLIRQHFENTANDWISRLKTRELTNE